MPEIMDMVYHNKNRYRQLDSLRGVAALCVLLCHYQLIFKSNSQWIYWFKISPLGVIVNGRSAVMFFFVLSGFVLSLPFVNNEKPLKITTFYVKRILRIYPAYLFAIFFSLALKTFFYDKNAMHQFSDWATTFWQWNWSSASYRELFKSMLLIGPAFNDSYFDPVVWSLVVEMQMSLIIPFFIIIVSRNRLPFNFLFFFSIIWIVYYNQSHYLGIFYLGILCARYKSWLISKIELWATPSVLGALLLGVFFYNIHFEFAVQAENAGPYDNLVFFLKDYITGLGAAIFLMIVIARPGLARFLQMRFFHFFGEISYSFYLLHLPILLTMCAVFNTKFVLSSLYIFVSTLSLTVFISFLNYRFIEKPFRDLGGTLIKKWKFLRAINLSA